MEQGGNRLLYSSSSRDNFSNELAIYILRFCTLCLGQKRENQSGKITFVNFHLPSEANREFPRSF